MSSIPLIGISTAADFSASTALAKDRIASAAQQFEGLLLHQLLKSSASSEDGGWLGTGEEDQAGLQAMDLAQAQFAEAMAARGGLGLAQLVISHLTADAKADK